MKAQQEKEELMLQADASRQRLLKINTFWVAGVLILVLIAGAGVLIYRRKKNQELLRQRNHQLEQLDQLKTRYFNNISHELRTPLSLILGPVNDVIEAEPLSDRARSSLKMASKSGNNMLSLVNEMLDLNKLKEGKAELQPSPTNLEDFLRSVLAPFHALAQLRQLDLAFQYLPMREWLVMLDQEKLKP